MRHRQPELTSPVGNRPVLYDAPPARAVRSVLSRAGHQAASGSNAGWVVSTPRAVSYLLLTHTGSEPAALDQYKISLSAAGYVVEDSPHQAGELVIFAGDPRFPVEKS